MPARLVQAWERKPCWPGLGVNAANRCRATRPLPGHPASASNSASGDASRLVTKFGPVGLGLRRAWSWPAGPGEVVALQAAQPIGQGPAECGLYEGCFSHATRPWWAQVLLTR